MAMGSKTLGIVAGLAVGASSGVFLAAMNPIVPRTDTTQIAPAPETADGASAIASTAETSLPDVAQVESTVSEPEAAVSAPLQTDTTEQPVEPLQPVRAPIAGDVNRFSRLVCRRI